MVPYQRMYGNKAIHHLLLLAGDLYLVRAWMLRGRPDSSEAEGGGLMRLFGFGHLRLPSSRSFNLMTSSCRDWMASLRKACTETEVRGEFKTTDRKNY